MRRRLDVLGQQTAREQELVRFRILRSHAAERGVRLRFLASVFERHRRNISFYFLKERRLYWMVDVLLVGEQSALEFVSEPLSECTTIAELIALLPSADARVQSFFDAPPSFSLEEKLSVRALYAFIKTVGDDNAVALKLVELGAALGDALRECHIYEYPELCILPYHSRAAAERALPTLRRVTLGAESVN